MTQGVRGESYVWPPLPGWYDQAACRGMGPDLFHPPVVTGFVSATRRKLLDAETNKARRVCDRCPVATACLADAMQLPARTDLATGAIRGGLTAQERRPQEVAHRRRYLAELRAKARQQ